MSFDIHQSGLKPGDWVEFTHQDKKIPEQAQGHFKVISSSNDFLDEGYLLLQDTAGKTVDYTPRMDMLGLTTLPFGHTVIKITDQKLIESLDAKLQGIFKKTVGDK